MFAHVPTRGELQFGDGVAVIGKCWVSIVSTVAFVPVVPRQGWSPTQYVKTHPCVAFVRCPRCKAKPGALCKSSGRPMTDTHADRRVAWMQMMKKRGASGKRWAVWKK